MISTKELISILKSRIVRDILMSLKSGVRKNVKTIAEEIENSSAGVSIYLARMEKAGMIISRQSGPSMMKTLDPDGLIKAFIPVFRMINKDPAQAGGYDDFFSAVDLANQKYKSIYGDRQRGDGRYLRKYLLEEILKAHNTVYNLSKFLKDRDIIVSEGYAAINEMKKWGFVNVERPTKSVLVSVNIKELLRFEALIKNPPFMFADIAPEGI